MKKVLGLDLGTTSIGWAVVNQAEQKDEKSSIIRAGVRVNPIASDEKDAFEKGKSITTNADRTLKRSMRRNLKRYQQRRSNLKELLLKEGWISEDTILAEHGNNSTFETYRLRSESVDREVSLEEFARILLMINKKRGYKSNRKADASEDGTLIDGMEVAKTLYKEHLTPGQYGYRALINGEKVLPDFYRSDLQTELDRIWDMQKAYYPEILTDDFKQQIRGRGRQDVGKNFLGKYKIYTADNKGKEKKVVSYMWRKDALTKQLPIEQVAYVIADISGSIKNSSGYLGEISDRSKELIFNDKTIGQYLYDGIKKDPHFKTKGKVFYRQDYIDEFNKLWESQSRFHPELTDELKGKIKDEIIFFQRRLKSQKGLISVCELEGKKITIEKEGKSKEVLVGPKVAPKSSMVFQEFKIWQVLNNVILTDKETGETRQFSVEEMSKLAEELQCKEKMSAKDALTLLFGKRISYEMNFKSLEGNRTYYTIVSKLMDIVNAIEQSESDVNKMSADEIKSRIKSVFKSKGFNEAILDFDSFLAKEQLEAQPLFKLWHLLYSYEGDDSKTGVESLIAKISDICKMPSEYARMLSSVTFTDDYGSLSNKAMKRILPYMKQGKTYSDACALAGYNHSEHSKTREELDSMQLVDHLEVLPKGALRNPVVEKIVNQMINLVNAVGEEYGRPDEIHVEFARELKQNQKQRQSATERIAKSNKSNEEYAKILKDEFHIVNPRKSDILRYKLYEELKGNAYKSLYSNKQIKHEQLFSNEIDIEHIIPQALIFDDSYSNKTLEFKDINIEKGKRTAAEFVLEKYGEAEFENYKARVNHLFAGDENKSKRKNLLAKTSDLESGFLNRDLVNTQYIAKKATEILETYVPEVVTTTGTITAKLREDWQLVDLMKELNMPKYEKAGLTHYEEHQEGKRVQKIDDWTKRNDHRHHEMDAITIAFTKRSHIKYLNTVHAKVEDEDFDIMKVKNKKILAPPMPLDELRAAFRKELESTLVSIKAKNKVVTRNVNKTKTKGKPNSKVELTPRGQLHKEQVYGQRKVYETYDMTIGGKTTAEEIANVASKREREALLHRLESFGGDPKKAFTGKNSLDKNPIFLDEIHSEKLPLKVKCVRFKTVYSIRKSVAPDLKVDKVLDQGVKKILEARLAEYGGDARKAFSNLDENPIWLNKEKGIQIKSVAIAENFDLDALRVKRDHEGKAILNENGNTIASDFVNLRSNHHSAIYVTADGEYHEKVVSFFEALDRINQGLPVIDKSYKSDEGWTFLFSMKSNEMFVFPDPATGFDPNEIDLMDPKNYALISPNLYRVQSVSSMYYEFTHHLETTKNYILALKDKTWKRIRSLAQFKGIVKVRINHLGEIVAVGEYD